MEELAHSSPKPLSVLIADDDEGIRNLLGRLLEIEGFTVETKRNGREALTRLSKDPADVGPPRRRNARSSLSSCVAPDRARRASSPWDVRSPGA